MIMLMMKKVQLYILIMQLVLLGCVQFVHSVILLNHCLLPVKYVTHQNHNHMDIHLNKPCHKPHQAGNQEEQPENVDLPRSLHTMQQLLLKQLIQHRRHHRHRCHLRHPYQLPPTICHGHQK